MLYFFHYFISFFLQKLFLILLLVTGFTFPGDAQDSCLLKLAGHVEDADTKEKLAGATVKLLENNRTITTDEKGDFLFYNICAGSYTLLVSHVDCESKEQLITLTKDKHVDIFIPHARNTLSEVVVAGKLGTPVTGFKQELSGRKLDETKGLSISEALSRINGVTLLQTGSTIAKPVIHGLHGNRILTINNGVRQEGQQWGNEHAPEIDPFIADKLIVVKGVDELKYGSDAVGGVIIIQPKALRTTPGYTAELNAGYFTNNKAYVVSAVVEQQLKKIPSLTYRLQGTFKKAANVTTPDYRLNNTAGLENNFSVTLGWKKKELSSELFYSRFSTKAGIFIGSHIGNLTDLENAIKAERPDPVFIGQNSYSIDRPYQDVVHQLVKSKTQWVKNGHKFNVLVAAQFNNRKEYDIVRTSTNTKPQLNLSISTISEDVNWEHPQLNHFSGVVGIAAMQQDNAYAGRYFIPNYQSATYGAYAIEKWNYHRWDLQAGLRVDHKTVNTNRLLTGGSSFDNYDFNFLTLASSFNAGYQISERWKTNINVSLASRAPHVNELLSNGIHHGTATYEEGDILLTTEKAINTVANISYQNTTKKIQLDLSIYTNHINDFIYQQPVPDEPVLTIAGAFPKIQYRQTNAVLSGLDFSAVVKPFNRIEWISRAAILRARNKKLADWLILMPADRVSTELAYNFKDGSFLKQSYLSIELQHVFKQSRVPSDKNGRQDYKVPPPAYSLTAFNGSSTVVIKKQPVVFSVSVRNLFNVAYRDYMNAMRYFTDEMGRNINFRISVPFSNK
jgi:iron complex outermembrane receptor protein